MVREKDLENEISSRSGKVREFCGWPGKFRKDVESQGIRKKMAIQANFRKFNCSVQEGKRCTFSLDSLSPSPLYWGLSLQERICSLGEQILSFKSNPQS